MEKHPWWLSLDESVLPKWEGKAEGVKPDGGGCVRGQGRVGPMRLWRAVNNRSVAGALSFGSGTDRCFFAACRIAEHWLLKHVDQRERERERERGSKVR